MGKNDDSKERITHAQKGSSQVLNPICSFPEAQQTGPLARFWGVGSRLQLNPCAPAGQSLWFPALETFSSKRTNVKKLSCVMIFGRSEPN